MSLAKAYEEYVDNGGKIAIGAFNFQTYVGVFFMLFLYKYSHCFEISFEKDDDISLKNTTLNKNFKIQVKSEKLTPAKIIETTKKDPKSILGKLLFNSNDYNYVVLVFGQERGKTLKEICKKENKHLGNPSYMIDCNTYENTEEKTSKKNKENYNKIKSTLDEWQYSADKLIFHETPFTTASDNCLHYLCGYSSDDYQGSLRKINIDRNQLLCILGSVYHSIDESSQISKFDNTIFQEIEKQNEEEAIIDELIEEIKLKKNVIYAKRLKSHKADYIEAKVVYQDLLQNINVPEYLGDEAFPEYLCRTAQEIFEQLDEKRKKRINIFTIEWYIIYEIVEREFMNYGNQN